MTKSDLIEQVATDTGMKKSDVRNILDSFLGNTTKALKSGDKVKLMGFGVFHPKGQSERPVRNPQTGAPVTLQPRKTVKFRIGIDLFRDLNE